MRQVLLAFSFCGMARAFLSQNQPGFSQRTGLGRVVRPSTRDGGPIFLAKKKKESFTEKQKRRAEKKDRYTSQKLVSAPPRVMKKDETLQETVPESATCTDSAGSTTEMTEENRLAKDIIEAQRTSVKVLTYVRECVDALPFDDISEALDSDGYYICDDFLKDEHSITSSLEKEGRTMLLQDDLMDIDVDDIGRGEYVASITGGEEQYAYCPRTVEFVVSITKHLPIKLTGDGLNNLDSSASMATMRTFDRNKLLASVALLQGKESDNDSSNNENPIAADVVDLLPRPFGVVTADDLSEARKVTLIYYPLSTDWDASCGAGITFDKGEGAENAYVEAKRDRLVLLRSDTCVHSRDMWKGKHGNEFGTCLELHFVAKAPSFIRKAQK